MRHISSKVMAFASAAVVIAGVIFSFASNANQVTAAPGPGVDYFLSLDGIVGDSTDAQHKDQISLLSYSWSKDAPALQMPTTVGGGGGGTGKVNVHDVYFTSTLSKASPLLMEAVATGKHIPNGTLYVRKAGKNRQEFYQIKLSDVIVTSYKTGAANNSMPTDEFSVDFAKYQVQYTPQNADGSAGTPITTGWDIEQNKLQ